MMKGEGSALAEPVANLLQIISRRDGILLTGDVVVE